MLKWRFESLIIKLGAASAYDNIYVYLVRQRQRVSSRLNEISPEPYSSSLAERNLPRRRSTVTEFSFARSHFEFRLIVLTKGNVATQNEHPLRKNARKHLEIEIKCDDF